MRAHITPLFLAIIAGTASAQLTDAERAEYIPEFEASCFKTQRNASVNSSLSNGTLHAFCSCMADYTANIYNVQFLSDVMNGTTQFNMQIVNLAAKYCAKRTISPGDVK